MGADYLEQDLQMTADGELVVLHDSTLDRTARGPAEACRGPVADQSLDALRRCEFGSWFNVAHPEHANPNYDGQPLPRLRDVLERYAGRARFYIETKRPDEAPGMEDALVGLLTEFNLTADSAAPPTVILQSFSAASLLKLRELAPDATLVQLLPGNLAAWAARNRLDEIAEYADGIGPQKDRVDRALVDAAHERGLVVHPYTVNQTPDLTRLIGLGVNGIFTDHPDVARKFVSSR